MLDDDGRDMLREGYRISAIGLEIALCVVLGLGGGLWLDRRFGTFPLLMMLLGAAGIAASIKVVVRLIRHTDLGEK
ncbi:MAG: AtpZ/AtpI family protein [Deltaproteobacteria bacterium]|nr:AtpZ/AtpI family protein [Deltaproteobacteria bacterium]